MADVKFSELTSLAAADVASDDILAIVDTGASTSKKLSIDNLFGAVPVNIAQTDATDATSSAGAVRTAGGVSMAKKLYVGTTSTLVGAVTATAGVFPATQDGAALGSTSLQFSDLFLADSAVIGFGDDNDTTLTHTDGAGLTLNGTNKLMFGDTGTYIHQSADGVLDLVSDNIFEVNATTIDVNGAVDVAGATFGGGALLPDASGTRDLGSTSAEWGDLYLGDDAVIYLQADSSTTLTGSADGILLNSTHKLGFGTDLNEFIQSSTADQLDLGATAEIEITAPIVDIDASTGIALDGANLNSAWTVNTTNKIQFHDTGNFIHAPANGQLLLSGDGIVDITGATDITLNTGLVQFAKAGADVVLKHETTAYDMVLHQSDGVEVARVFNGDKALPTYASIIQTDKGGFGYRKSVIAYTADSSSNVLQLTAAESGSVILVNCNSYSGGIKLPACATAAEAGMHFEFYLVAANGGSTTFYVETAGADGNDEITGYLHNPAQTSAGADITVDTAGDRVTFIAATGLGAHLSMTCMVGHGTTERWVAHAYTPTDHVPTLAD